MTPEDMSLTPEFLKNTHVTNFSDIPYIIEMPSGESLQFSSPGVGLKDESFKTLMTVNVWMQKMVVPEIVNLLYHLFESNRELDEVKFRLNGYFPSNSKFTYMDFDIGLTLITDVGGGIFNAFRSETGRLEINDRFDPDRDAEALKESGISLKLVQQSLEGLVPLLQKAYLYGMRMPFTSDQHGFRVSRKEIHDIFHEMEIYNYQDLNVYVGREKSTIPWYVNSIALYYRDKVTGEFDFTDRKDLNPWSLLRTGEWNASTAHTMAINARDYDPQISMIESLFQALKYNEQANLVLRMKQAMEEHPNLPRILFRERHNFVVNDLYPISTNFIDTKYINATVAKIQANPNFISDEMDDRWVSLHESYALAEDVELSHKHLKISM